MYKRQADDCKEFLQKNKIEELLNKYCKFMAVPVAFAAEEETNATAAYNMNVKMSSLADALSLNLSLIHI